MMFTTGLNHWLVYSIIIWPWSTPNNWCTMLLSPWGQRGDVYVLVHIDKRTKEEEKKDADLQMRWLNHMCVFCAVLVRLCMHRACLPMQSSTDGRVGGWVLSAHRSSCGSVVPLLFTAQARRACQTRSMDTYQGWILCLLLMLFCYVGRII